MIIFLFVIIIFLFSAIIHEVSHGAIAYWLGDPTAKLMGRLTLNPLPHLDPFGSIILPLLLAIPALFGQPTFIFGWAKPVPYNPQFLKDPKRGAAIIALAGPASNLLIALVFGLLVRSVHFPSVLTMLISTIVWINILLAVFNLVPIPPLDGSKLLIAILPRSANSVITFMERYGTFVLLFFLFFGFDFIIPVITRIFELFTGMNIGVLR